MKSYTDLKQSKKLAEILPIDSADMYYSNEENITLCSWNDDEHDYDDIPAWSLAALIDIIPESVIEPYYALYLQKEDGKYSIGYGNDELLCVADNLVDACYKMILELHEQNLL